MSEIGQTGICIYCGAERIYSKEHYLPECLGEFDNYELLNDRICKVCNNNLSKLDMVLCRTSTTGAFRKLFEIEGRRKEEPWDPFRKGFGYIPPVKIFDDKGVEYESSGIGDASVRNKRQLVIYNSKSKIITIAIPDWAIININQMKRFLSKIELHKIDYNNVESIAIHADDNERKLVIDAVNELKLFHYKNIKIEWSESPDDKLKDVVFGSLITDKYMRAVAKVCFHYFLKHFPNYKGSEPQFDEIRKFIKTGENIKSGRDIDSFVSIMYRPISRSQLIGHLPSWNGHILVASIDHYGYRAWVQFFVISKNKIVNPTYQVFIGRNPYPIFYIRPAVIAHRFEYFESGKQGWYDGQVIKVSNIELYLP